MAVVAVLGTGYDPAMVPRKPDTEEGFALRKKGWTLQQIADKYGVTKQAVQQRLKRSSLSRPQR